jgi:hypothetical protein
MDLVIILVVVGLALGLLAYYFYRLLLSIQHTLQDMRANTRSTAEWSRSTATQSMHTKANVKYLVEYLEARFGQSDELRRQVLLQQIRREALSRQDTPITPLIVTPQTPVPPPWLGDQAMAVFRRTRKHQ